eukprot:2600007-Amphidinium_carterae.1
MCNGDVTKVHRDNNTGASWVRALGNFTGGLLWVAGDGHANAPQELLPLPEGCPTKGKLVDLSKAWFCLDASQYHGVCAVTSGTRYSISAYVCRAVHKLSRDHWHELGQMGFAIHGM